MTLRKKVLHSDGSLQPFKPRLIKEQLLNETDIDEELADKIKVRVTEKIKKMNVDTISTSTIRSEVLAQLTSRGLFKAEEDSRILGTTVKTIEDMLNSHIKDNANMGDNSETFYKYIAEKSLEQYTFTKLPDYISDAHIFGYIHIHDRADFFIKPNCLSYDIRWFLKNGLSCDGDIKRTSIANPAKHFNVLIQHLLQALMSGKVDLSGGQGFPLFNIFLSPLTVDLDDKELKQNLQTCFFGSNMSCVSKGEVVFSSIGLHPACPDYLYNEQAMTYGGVLLDKTYGDFEDEAKRIFRIICELLEEGDASKRPFRFPNTICHLRDEYSGRIDDELFYFCKYLRRYPTGYFANDDMENGGGIRALMGCRTASNNTDNRFTWEENILNTGNLAFHTLNLPLIAIESKDLDDFYRSLDKYMDIVVDSLLIRREAIQKRLDNNKLPFLNWHDKDGNRLYRIESTTLSIGYAGLNECILELTNGEYNINTSYGVNLGKDIIQRIVERSKRASKETGFKFGCFSTPAESTCGRFASINKNKHPNAFVNGKKGSYYLTNSHHINVSEDTSILNHIKNANEFHKLANFGSILHIFISETPDVDALINLTKKIKEYDIGFWSYTLDFSICNNCQTTVLKNVNTCPNCGSSNITTYSKITGYYVPLPNWGAAKVSEFNDRNRYIL